jgi:hypothetical protein
VLASARPCNGPRSLAKARLGRRSRFLPGASRERLLVRQDWSLNPVAAQYGHSVGRWGQVHRGQAEHATRDRRDPPTVVRLELPFGFVKEFWRPPAPSQLPLGIRAENKPVFTVLQFSRLRKYRDYTAVLASECNGLQKPCERLKSQKCSWKWVFFDKLQNFFGTQRSQVQILSPRSYFGTSPLTHLCRRAIFFGGRYLSRDGTRFKSAARAGGFSAAR